MAATRRARIVRDSMRARTVRREAEWASKQRRIAAYMREIGLPLLPWQRQLLDRIRPGARVTAFGRPIGQIDRVDSDANGLSATFALVDEFRRALLLGDARPAYTIAESEGHS